jgi:hypothetical protein
MPLFKRNEFIKGDWNVIDDRTGRKRKASHMLKEWTGRVVHRKEWESRHPQDFVRGVRDKQNPPVRMVTSEETDGFLGPNEVNEDNLTGAGDVRFTRGS